VENFWSEVSGLGVGEKKYSSNNSKWFSLPRVVGEIMFSQPSQKKFRNCCWVVQVWHSVFVVMDLRMFPRVLWGKYFGSSLKLSIGRRLWLRFVLYFYFLRF
jgi:hypothetical protein